MDGRPDPALLAAVDSIRNASGSARSGLSEEVFLLVSSLTPLVNVDLLIHDQDGRCLLTWRHDDFYGPGWHVPGGIIRFKESAADRIAAVAAHELGARVGHDPEPIRLFEITNPERDARGHFISLLYACRLESPPDPSRRWDPAAPRHGDWAWHQSCPAELIVQHERFRRFIAHGSE